MVSVTCRPLLMRGPSRGEGVEIGRSWCKCAQSGYPVCELWTKPVNYGQGLSALYILNVTPQWAI